MVKRPGHVPLLLAVAACGGGASLDEGPDDTADAAVADASVVVDAAVDARVPLFDGAPVDAASSAADGALPPDAAVPLVPQFTKHPANPVLEPSSTDPLDGAWDRGGVYEPTVVPLDDGSRVMFYLGNDDLGPHYGTGRAVSSDGVSWVVDPEPSLDLINEITALEDGGQFSLYYMHYYDQGLRLATSTDGITWDHSDQNPLISEATIYSLTAVSSGAGVELWYIDYEWGDPSTETVIFATSPDGLTFTTAATNLTGLAGDDAIGRFSVIRDGSGGYQMWMVRGGEGVDYLTSPDGITWTERGRSLAAGGSGTWDEEIHGVTIVRDDGVLEMWYTGRAELPDDTHKIYRIGYATSQ